MSNTFYRVEAHALNILLLSVAGAYRTGHTVLTTSIGVDDVGLSIF
jgi:hypothetical protein